MAERDREKALVVDDDVSIRVMLTKVLQHENFEVDNARDGVEALEKITATHYDVIFLDLMMPRVDGIRVLRYLRAHAPEEVKSVIVMTAFNNIASEVYEGDSVPRIMSKPFDIHAVVENARDLISNSRNQTVPREEINPS
ncbi:MAG TPA: response regulator [Thermoanaerobaculia bacterium]|nr:response regulator [Thermoanaerobaculia bacterium]